MEKVIVFIDGSNFYFGCRDYEVKAPGDMVSLARDITGPDRRLVRVYYYNARSNEEDMPADKYAAEEKFYDYLRRMDYCTVRLGRIEGKGPAKHQKGVDTLLVQDMLTLTFEKAFDCAVLIANDGDYASVINEVKRKGMQVEVAFVGDRPAFHLREVCDRYIDLLAACPRHFEPLSNMND